MFKTDKPTGEGKTLVHDQPSVEILPVVGLMGTAHLLPRENKSSTTDSIPLRYKRYSSLVRYGVPVQNL